MADVSGGPKHAGRSPYRGPQDNDLKWTYEAGSTAFLGPVIGPDGTVYVGSLDGNLCALNPDGTLKWTCEAGTVPALPAIGSNETIYFESMDGKLYAIGGETEKVATCPLRG